FALLLRDEADNVLVEPFRSLDGLDVGFEAVLVLIYVNLLDLFDRLDGCHSKLLDSVSSGRMHLARRLFFQTELRNSLRRHVASGGVGPDTQKTIHILPRTRPPETDPDCRLCCVGLKP